jgi:carbamoylphosphate synthase small subunit
MVSLASGQRFLDARTRDFIHEHLTYRVLVTVNGVDARALETRVRHEGLKRAGRPLINP